jgi:release factor glutamine methyltransferase
MFAKMTINEIYKTYLATLNQMYAAGEAIAITNIIFEYIAKCSKTDIIAKGNNQVDTAILKALQEALQKLLLHEPVQYITGEAWFYQLKFAVNKAVLIPRPETEELVLEAIQFLKNNPSKSVLDIGTGSGCIPISIKKNVPDAIVISLDVSEAALAIAKKNANANAVDIVFKNIDFLQEANYALLPTFDVIISNPPYIPENEKQQLAKNVTQYEPHLALFVPTHEPLLFYKKILIFAELHLHKTGCLFLEVHEDLANETAAIFKAKNYVVNIKKDMQGKDRMLVIYRYQTP